MYIIGTACMCITHGVRHSYMDPYKIGICSYSHGGGWHKYYYYNILHLDWYTKPGTQYTENKSRAMSAP